MRQRVEVVSSVALPVDETLEIKRCRYIGETRRQGLKGFQ